MRIEILISTTSNIAHEVKLQGPSTAYTNTVNSYMGTHKMETAPVAWPTSQI